MRKKTTIICPECNNSSEKDASEVKRQYKKGNPIYCSKSCALAGAKKKMTKHHELIRNCLFCKKDFNSTTHVNARTCCSVTCGVKYAQSYTDPLNTSASLKEYYKNNIWTRNGEPAKYLGPKEKIHDYAERSCIVCKNIFKPKRTATQKTCSKKCLLARQKESSRLHPNCGGETNYKKHLHNGIYMDSSWEVELAKWMDDKHIKWQRSKLIWFFWTRSDGKKCRYYPDFYLEDYDVYLDPKNKYLQIKDEEKLINVQTENNIIIFSGLVEDIKTEINALDIKT